jgi:hypothetical protein
LAAVSRRAVLLVALNWLFLGLVLFGALVGQVGLAVILRWPVDEKAFTVGSGDAVLFLVSLFASNLFLSGFVVVTLTGLCFFGFPLFFLCFRAFSWGLLLNELPTPSFLAALPTLVIEGEGYVLATLAGVVLGMSWLKPRWAYQEDEFSRPEALKEALKECARVYVLVMLLLFVAAVVETVTLFIAS